ncbi:hypothetical protein QTP88_012696 [Uroleucon formosanum]
MLDPPLAHDRCESYFCKGPQTNEKNMIEDVERSELMSDISQLLSRLVANVDSLLMNIDNNVCEQFNSVINKYLAGKRINYSQRNSYNARVEAAVIPCNSGGKFLRLMHKNMVDEIGPGKIFLASSEKKRCQPKSKKLIFFGNSEKRYNNGPDQHYGLAEPLLEDNISKDELEKTKENFINALRLDKHERLATEEKTRDQANSQIWHVERRNRLTASNFGRVSTDYGKATEPQAIAALEKQLKCKVNQCGLIIDEHFSYLAASPDGLINDDFIVENKCPFGIKDTKTFLEAINSKKLSFCRLSENGKIELKVDHSYHYQVQGQMQISKRHFCYFVVYSVNWMEKQIISFDDSFWREKMFEKLKVFYTEYLLPELVNLQYGKRLLVDDILDPQHILENIKTKKLK